jgi:hypothetical protein
MTESKKGKLYRDLEDKSFPVNTWECVNLDFTEKLLDEAKADFDKVRTATGWAVEPGKAGDFILVDVSYKRRCEELEKVIDKWFGQSPASRPAVPDVHTVNNVNAVHNVDDAPNVEEGNIVYPPQESLPPEQPTSLPTEQAEDSQPTYKQPVNTQTTNPEDTAKLAKGYRENAEEDLQIAEETTNTKEPNNETPFSS